MPTAEQKRASEYHRRRMASGKRRAAAKKIAEVESVQALLRAHEDLVCMCMWLDVDYQRLVVQFTPYNSRFHIYAVCVGVPPPTAGPGWQSIDRKGSHVDSATDLLAAAAALARDAGLQDGVVASGKIPVRRKPKP